MKSRNKTRRDNPRLEPNNMTERESLEESLRRSERKLWQYLEASPDAIYVHDLKGNFLYGNRAAESMIGYSKEELIGKSFLDLGLLPLDSLAKAIHLLEFSAAGKPTGPDEFQLIRKDGSQISVEISTYAIGEADKIEVIGIVRDISERKRLEQERAEAEVLRRTHKTIERLLEGMNDGYCVIQGYTIVYLNSMAAEMFGYTKDQVVGKRIEDYLPPSIVRQLSRVYSTGLSGGIVPPQYQTILTKKDGTAIQVELGGRAIEYGGKPALSIVIRDVSDRKLMEKALMQKEQDYLILLESTDDAIIVVDAKTLKVVFGNQRSARMFGFDPVLHDGRGVSLLDFIHPDDRDTVVRAFLEDTYMQERRQRYEVRAKTREGKQMWVSALATRIEFGGRVAVLLSLRDVTENKLVEDALRNSEERLRLYFENVTDVIYSMDPELKVTSVSPSVEKLLGYKPEELIGKNLAELNVLAPEYMEAAFSDIVRVLTGGRIAFTEYEFVTKDGRRRVGQVSGAPLFSPEGKVIGLVSMARDITEHKKAEVALRESEGHYAALVRHLSDAVFIFRGGVITWCNDRVEEIYGYPKAELLGKNESLFYPKDINPRDFARVVSTAIKDKGLFRSTTKFEKKDSSLVDIEYSLSLIPGTEPLEVIAVARDVTDRKNAEQRIRESEERYRSLVETAGAAIVTTDSIGQITFVNEAGCKMVGYPGEELIGRPFADFIHPDDKPKVRHALSMAFRGHTAPILEFRLIHRHGHTVWCYSSPTVIARNNKIVGFSGIIHDITRRRQMEEQLRLAGRLAAVGELAAGVAHELNNPLAAIQGFAQLLTARDGLDETMKKDLQTMYTESKRAARITRNLLAFSRKHEPDKRLISINEVVEKSFELTMHQLKIDNIEVVVELQPDLPITVVDSDQMQEVFVNIINNAEQAMLEAHGKGKLVVRTRKSGGMIQITFTDDGPGISNENLQRIFDPFFTTKAVGKGTGLGLSICYGIVQAHGGEIRASSEPGKGATFVVEVPIASVNQLDCSSN